MKKMSVRRRIAITARGFGILKQYCPGLAQGKALNELLNSLQPFVTVWFTAQIINEVTSRQRWETLILYVSCLAGINFLFAAAKGMVGRVCSQKESQMWSWFGKIFSDKQMSLDFADLENAGIQLQKKQVEENLFMFGNGLAQLVWGTSTLVRAFTNIAASTAMTFTLFASRSGSKFIDHPAWIFVLLMCIAAGGFGHSRATVKENSIFTKWCKETVWFNRVYSFFGRDLYMMTQRAADVRIYGQNFVAEKVLDGLIRKGETDRGSVLRMALFPALSRVMIGLVNAVCYLFVAAKAFYGAFGAGSIVQYVTVLSRLGDGLQDLMFMFSDNEVYCTYLQELFDYLDIPNRKYQGTIPVEKRFFCDGGDNEYEIEFRNVSFKYPATDRFVLKNVSAKIRAGRRLAIVGENGSGKTTFIKLLCRLYDPTEGEILLNGIDIRKYDYQEYMTAFAVVFQDFRLFSLSLAQNVSCAAQYDSAQVERCLREAGFGDRLMQMPDGIETCLYKDAGEDGVSVSGGEAQKVALARAIYKNAPFIVLDEPTAALDPIAEADIYGRFHVIAGSRTAVFISHRLSSCIFCDEILVFREGEIAERGTHSELLQLENGRYRMLWDAQAQYYR